MGFLDSVKGALKSAVSGHASKDAATRKSVVVEEAETAPAAPIATEPPVPAARLESYTVKAGDTLGEISVRSGVSIAEIVTLNNIENPDLIFPGQVFRVPKH